MALCGVPFCSPRNQRGHYSKQIRADVNVESTNDYLGSLFAAARNRAK